MTSVSMISSFELVRSWLRRSLAVSRFVSTSSVPPVTKPAIRMRWKREVSNLGCQWSFEGHFVEVRATHRGDEHQPASENLECGH